MTNRRTKSYSIELDINHVKVKSYSVTDKTVEVKKRLLKNMALRMAGSDLYWAIYLRKKREKRKPERLRTITTHHLIK